MLNCTVKDTAVVLREGTAKSGKPYSMREQEAFVSLSNGEFRKIKLILRKEQPAYAVGSYSLNTDESVSVDQFGALELRNLVLKLIK